jgi:hypothetical protein
LLESAQYALIATILINFMTEDVKRMPEILLSEEMFLLILDPANIIEIPVDNINTINLSYQVS